MWKVSALVLIQLNLYSEIIIHINIIITKIIAFKSSSRCTVDMHFTQYANDCNMNIFLKKVYINILNFFPVRDCLGLQM